MKKTIRSLSLRAAMLLATFLLTLSAQPTWAQNQLPEPDNDGNVTISAAGDYDANGEIYGNLIINTSGEVTLNVQDLSVHGNIVSSGGNLNLIVSGNLTATDIQEVTLTMNSGTIQARNLNVTTLTMNNGNIYANDINAAIDMHDGEINASSFSARGAISGGTIIVTGTFTAGYLNKLTIRGGTIDCGNFYIRDFTIDASTVGRRITANSYQIEGDSNLSIVNGNVSDGTNVYVNGDGAGLKYYLQSSGRTTLTAVEIYTVSFYANGGEGSMSNQTFIIDVEQALSNCEFTRTGYTFAGWATDADGDVAYTNGASVSNLTTTADAMVELYAKWTPITYTVTFNANGGDGNPMANQAFTYDVAQDLSACTYTRTGYTFAGWATTPDGAMTYNDEESVNNLTTTADATVTLFAKWTSITYTVTFDKNGGDGDLMANQAFTYDVAQDLSACTYTRTGYTFAGWATTPDGAMTYNDEESVNNLTTTADATVTLFAKWTANTYTVNLDPQEGSGGTGSVTVTYDAAMPSATMPTRTGYIFCGYFTGTNGGGIKYYNADGSSAHTWDIADNTTLYAYWKKLLTNGDIHVDIPAQTYNGTVLDPVVTVKDGETVISNDNNEHYTIALPEGRTNADDFVVTITAKDESALYAGSVTATFTINKAPLTVTANNKSIKYGDMADNNGVTYSGFVENEDERVLGGTLGFEYNYNQYDPVGNYDITPSGLTAANYDITFASGTLTVAKKSLTITANDHRILYGNAAENNGVSYAGFVNGETENVLSGELKYTYTNDSGPYGAGNDAPGEYVITPYDLTATNYAITFVPGKLTVEAITVKVKVVDIDNGEELTGAHVQVLNTEENFVEEWDSGTGIHEVGGLKAGKTYTVHETVAPDGYLLPTDKTFTIAANGTITYSGTKTTDESGNTVLLVQNSMTHVEVSVVGTHNEGKLSGATVQVLDTENNVVEEWTSTTENHIIEGLETGVEYTIHETEAPEGYLPSSDYKFTIDQEGTITTNGPTTVESGKTVLLVQNDMCINLSVAINWNDFENKYSVRPTTVTVTLSDGTNETSYPLNNDSNPLTCTVEKLQKYKNGTEIVYSWTITGELDCYEQHEPQVDGTTTTFAMNLMYNGNCGTTGCESDVTWNYDTDSKTITISGSGPGQMADYASADAQPWKAYLSELVSITIGSGVTSIGNNAFAGCTSLTSIDIPAHVTLIGADVFNGCSSLKTVTMLGDNPPTLGKDPDSDTGPFYNCPSLSVILVPNETVYTAYMNAETWNGTATDAEENTTDYTHLLAPAAITLGVSTSGWATYCHKYIVNYSVEGGEAYTVSGIDNRNVQTATVENVAPYTPILVYKENGGDVTLTALPATATQVVPDNYNEGLGIVQETIGSTDATIQGVPGDDAYASGENNIVFAISDNNDYLSYVLYKGDFVAVDEDGGIAAHRCWLNVNKNSTNGARMLSISKDDESVGIEVMNFTNSTNASGAWYGIDGRKFDSKPTKKGLYIYNGKKHVIK